MNDTVIKMSSYRNNVDELTNKCSAEEKKVVVQSSLTLCDPADYSPPGSSVHRILQARILDWVAILFSRRSSQPGDETGSPALQADSLLFEPPGKPKRSQIQKNIECMSPFTESSKERKTNHPS